MKVKQAQKDRQHVSEELDKACNILRELEMRNDDLVHQLKNMENLHAQCSEKIQNAEVLQSEVLVLRQKLEQAELQVAEQSQSDVGYAEALQRGADRIHHLESEVALLKKRVADSDEVLRQKDVDVNSSKESVSKLSQVLDQISAEREQLSLDLKAAEARAEDLATELASIQQILDRTEIGKAEVEARLAQRDAALRAESESVEQLRAELQSLQRESEAQKSEVQALRVNLLEAEAVRAEAEALRQRAESQAAEHKDAEAARLSANKDVEALRAEVKALQAKLEAAEAVGAEAEALRQQHADAEAARLSANKDVEALRAEVKALQAKLEAAEAVGADVEALRQQHADAEAALLSANKDVEALRAKMEALQAKLDEAEAVGAEAEALRHQVAAFAAEQAGLSDKAMSARAEADGLRQELEKVNAEASALQARLAEEQGALTLSVSSSKGDSGEMDALRAELASLELAREEADELRAAAEERAVGAEVALAGLREEVAALRQSEVPAEARGWGGWGIRSPRPSRRPLRGGGCLAWQSLEPS